MSGAETADSLLHFLGEGSIMNIAQTLYQSMIRTEKSRFLIRYGETGKIVISRRPRTRLLRRVLPEAAGHFFMSGKEEP